MLITEKFKNLENLKNINRLHFDAFSSVFVPSMWHPTPLTPLDCKCHFISHFS